MLQGGKEGTRTATNQMRATLQNAFQKLSVDREARIVTGIKLLENNRDVLYKGADGKPVGFRTNEALLAGLLAHAGNRTIPSHLTHEWTEGKRDALHDRVGGIKNCRLSANGDLIGDYHAMPGANGDSILWLAENDPEHAMLSLVFDYNPIKTNEVTYAVPLNFSSADFVAQGAGVSAMLSKTTDTDMTKEEITDLIRAELKGYKLPENLATKEDIASAVKAALSDFKPAVSDEDAKKIALLAKADAVAEIGKHTAFVQATGAVKQTDEFTAQLEVYRKTAPNEATAIARLLKDHPELNEAREQHVRATLSAFNS